MGLGGGFTGSTHKMNPFLLQKHTNALKYAPNQCKQHERCRVDPPTRVAGLIHCMGLQD